MSTIHPVLSCEPGQTTHVPAFETGFTPWDNSHLFSVFDSSMNKITHSVHEYLSPDSVNRSGPDVVATDSYTDERRKKRKLSNRESAKRSRVKKQKHLEEMNIQLNQLKIENRELENQIRYVIQHFQRTETENNRLRLEQRLLHSTLLNIRQVWMLHQIDRSSDYVTWPYDENTRVTVQHDPSVITNHIIL
ncbi:basic leucine zipper 4 [Brassica rapa]|uniref:BZIP domain-containing protein n=2 Tax=Brassica TaxID=3705 RepID=M4F4M5_BRACM|nr:basic leucine zipper 4 [Brassica rapa]XP_013751226.2 basic leucine zipper 4-like [Brassica napus]CAF2046374.1 unnamed protein product [Brassica napus]